MPARAEQAAARLQIENRLGGRPAGELVSPYISYHLPLGGFHPSGAAQNGLIVTARINGGRRVRLLLDTGARGLLLHRSAARGLGLEPITSAGVSGFGDGSAADGDLMLARRIAFDNLEFRDCLLQVSPRDLTPGADGILGPSLFERFRLRIDPRSRTLELTPGEPEELADAPHVLGLNHLFLVRTNIEGGREGWFLLDTGAAFTTLGRAFTSPQLSATPVDLTGMQGLAGAFRAAPIALRVGPHALAEAEPVALDLSAISQREGVEISGILGYSTLSRWPVTLDFRTGLLRIGEK
jgi:predicted aspartyl protease